ncbi:MAG: AmmeMemoRadiSam system protein B, partial [Anaerolineae bacterium]
MNIRQPAVAGSFYPAEAGRLRGMIERFLAETAVADPMLPKAIIAPHAGYVYSGPIAASAYAHVRAGREVIRWVVMLGPAHRVFVRGLAASSAAAFATPLGEAPVDGTAVQSILDLPQVQVRDDAHAHEHSLEVHLPFLQVVLDEFAIVPLAVGEVTAEAVSQVLERLWGGPETLILISSDLSHYLDYAAAQKLDGQTAQAINQLLPQAIGQDQACGRLPIQGLLNAAQAHQLKVNCVDLRNSGDTAGPRD